MSQPFRKLIFSSFKKGEGRWRTLPWAGAVLPRCFLSLTALSAALAYGGTVTCTNGASDAAMVQSGVNAGGTLSISGTCNFARGGVTVNGAVTIVGSGATPTINGNGSNSGYAFTVNADNVSITGLTFNNGIGAVYLNGAIRRYFTFDYNTVENTAAVPAAFQAGGIISHGDISHNVWYMIGPAGMQSFNSSNWATPVGSGIPGTPNCYSYGNDCDSPAGIGILIYGGIDNTTVEWNNANWVGDDWMHLQMLSLGTNSIWKTAATNDSVSYNTVQHGHRYALELQGVFDFNSSCGAGQCDFSRYWFTGFKVNGNYSYNPPAGIYYNTWSYSIVMDIGTGTFENNTAMNGFGATPGYGTMGYAFENGWNTVTNQGNVASGIPQGAVAYQGKIYNNGTYSAGFAYQNQINPPGYPAGLYTTQNNVLCSVGTVFGNEPGGTFAQINRYNYINTSVTNSCPGAPTPQNSAIQFGLLSSSASGSNTTWNFSVVSNLSVRWVQYFLDNSSTPLSTQEVQDLNSNFANDLKWLYHVTVNTGSLSSGPHTLRAVATDVSGATQVISRAINGSGSGTADPTVSPASLALGSVAIAVNSAGAVTLSNTGSVAFSLSGTNMTGNNASDFTSNDSACGASIAPGASCQISVKFTPTVAGLRTATLNVITSSAILTVSLTGTGTQSTAVGLTVSSPQGLFWDAGNSQWGGTSLQLYPSYIPNAAQDFTWATVQNGFTVCSLRTVCLSDQNGIVTLGKQADIWNITPSGAVQNYQTKRYMQIPSGAGNGTVITTGSSASSWKFSSGLH